MRSRRWLILTLLLVLSVASPVWAREAMIETTAPLQDHAEQSIKTALTDALETAMKGALAMGFAWVQIGKAVVLEDAVSVQLLATDSEPEAAGGHTLVPDESEAVPGQPAGLDQ